MEEVLKSTGVVTKLLLKHRIKRNVRDVTRVFLFDGNSFSAVSAAEKMAKHLGYRVGSMAQDAPIGLANAEKYQYIAKWYNIEKEERHLLEGVLLSEDFRNGDVYMVLFD